MAMALALAAAVAASSAFSVPVGGTLPHRSIRRRAKGEATPTPATTSTAASPNRPGTSATRPVQLRPRRELPASRLELKLSTTRLRPMRTSD